MYRKCTFWRVAFTFLVDGGCACVIWRASERVWNIWTGAGRELKKYVCVGGISGATNCVCVWAEEQTVVVRCHQDATADKRPTSYGNSNSVQVFSASTFAAQRAADWPGEQPGPQGRLSELQSVQTKAWRPDWLSFFEQSLVQKHTPLLSVSLACGDPLHNLS